MRISNSNMRRNYLSNMTGSFGRLNGSNDKLSSQHKFTKPSEDVMGATKALRVRKMLKDDAFYMDNIRNTQSRLSAAEGNMMELNTKVTDAVDRMTQALNGVYNESDREKMATEIECLQQEVLQVANATYSGQFLFGATGGAVRGEAPFTVDGTGNLLFNGSSVKDVVKGADGTLTINGVPVPYNSTNYVDIGLGYEVEQGGADGPKLNTNTAVPLTLSGLELFGYGKTAEGVSKNLYTLLGEVAGSMRSGDTELLGKQLSSMGEVQDGLLVSLTKLGNQNSFLDAASSRIDSEVLNLREMQNSIEGVDVAEEIIYNKSFEQSWMVTLQMGSKVLPTSLFDFMR